MGRVTVGYQDGGFHPLWLLNASMRAARLFGAESLWLPDHFMSFIPAQVWKPEVTAAANVVTSPDAFFDPIQILAVASQKMRGIDVGTLVTEPLRRHPMSLAQSFVTLDHLSKGHAILGIGNGERENVEPYGLPWNKQVGRLEEALTIIRLLWESEGRPVSYDGKFWKLKDALFSLPLYDGKPPRIWIASHAPRMLGLTGRFGDGWVPTLKVTADVYRARLDTILAAGADAGRNMDHFVAGQATICAIGESREQILELAMKSRLGASMTLLLPAEAWAAHGKVHPLGADHKGFIDIVPTRVTDEHIDEAQRTMSAELLEGSLYAGNAAEIRDELAPLVGAGARHLIIANMGPALTGGSPRDMLRLASLIRKLRRL
jgi:phthiodiolone/phenolphthiodiolone dimycocerosates ketoreductase